ncbi:MAG TPA: BON domain-containing protein [Pirellulales bacterium]|jgi:osmotically-inducible protein OsmY|nr:BON domain-containing protein [Pirellulales bacterium]
MYQELESFHEEADRDLERRVTAFLADRNLPALRRLGVRSHRGVVTLRGQVRSFYEKQLGGESARRVAGVIDVIDAIQVASDAGLLSAQQSANARRSTPTVVVSFESHRAAGVQSYGASGAQSYSAGGLDPISQAKG